MRDPGKEVAQRGKKGSLSTDPLSSIHGQPLFGVSAALLGEKRRPDSREWRKSSLEAPPLRLTCLARKNGIFFPELNISLAMGARQWGVSPSEAASLVIAHEVFKIGIASGQSF